MTSMQTRTFEANPTPSRRDGSRAVADLRRRLLRNLPVAERHLRLGGIVTAVLEGGEGPPLVLLHGPGEYAAKWLRVIPQLVTTHRVIAPDLPGHGASAAIDGQSGAQRVLAWLDDLIECTCATPPVLAGQIIGGAIAARFAATHGERISGLVLVDTLGLAPFQPTPEFGQALSEFFAKPDEQTHDRLWNRCAFDLDAMRERMGEQWEDIMAYNLDRALAPGLHETQRGLMEQFGLTAIAAEDLARIAVPTTLIWGRHDLATPVSVAQAASTRYGWPLHVIERAADDPPMEQPEAFVDTLRTVLDKAYAATPDTRAAWDGIADRYDRTNTPTQMRLAHEGLHRAGLRAGMQFLDVAAGSGALSIPAARLGAQVMAIDQSSAMLELLARRARNESLNIDTRVMDGHALKFDDESFDMAGSQFGVMLFPDMARGIREMARVVRPGGCVLMHAYGDPHEIEFLGFLIAAVQSVRPDFTGPPIDPAPLEFQAADPDRLRRVLAGAGLKQVKVETVMETTEHASGRDLWEWLIGSNPIVERIIGGMLGLTQQERQAVVEALDALVCKRADGGRCARLTNPVNIGFGTK